ncbi:MAG: regulator of sigma E protease [Cryomorphaceae bacterium]|jgi:regulator of sigma E protease
MSFLYSVIGFILAIGVLVAVHEFGHFWVARKLGVKVLTFSIGFGKPLWKKVAGPDQTEYVLAAIPLGGYVKMLGEGAYDYPIPEHELHRSFDRQPIWKRSLIVLAGPGINFLFAILLFMLLGMNTEKNLVPEFGDLPELSSLYQAGVVSGDTLVAVDGKPTRHLFEHDLYIFNQVLKRQSVELEVSGANGVRKVMVRTDQIPIYNINPGSLMRQLGFVPIAPPTTTAISGVSLGSPAEQAGLQAGDRFISIDNVRISSWRELSEIVVPAAGKSLPIVIQRSGVELNFNITPESREVNGQQTGLLGVARAFTPYPDNQIIEFSRNPFQALQYGTEKTWLMSSLTLRMLWKMVTLQVSHKNVNGPITIADVAGQAIQIGWETYVYVLAVISISLGVMNLLPIPMLDGGHLLMYVVEAAAGKNISEKVFAIGQRVGVLLLVCLMSLAFYNDIFRLLN